MALEHFSHKHTLIFNEDLQQNENSSCFGCKEPISGQSYSCEECNFFLHKACAELPCQIKHTFHRKHPLILQENPPHNDFPCFFKYHCSLCNFSLDKKCALLPCVPTKNNHQFIWLLDSRIPYNCDSCGGDGFYDSYASLCIICQVLVHYDCESLLPIYPTIAIRIHDHPLIHTFFIHENESGEQYCGICNDEILTDHGCYFCSQCSFISHAGCAFEIFIYECKTVMAQCNAEESVDHCVIEKSTRVKPMDSINYGIIEMKIEDDSTATEMEIDKFSNANCHLKYISHKHPLVFNEEEQQNYSYSKENSCFGCEELVLGPSYNCSQCNFFLHKTCAELPLKIKHPFHRKHPLVLILDTSNVGWRRPACFFCNESCRRFAYSCSNCACYLDIKCATLSCVIEPEAHEHQFIHWMRAIPFTCNACGEKESEQTPYFCTACQVKVHKSCISLPHSIKIIQHNHPLHRNHFFHENVSAGSLNCGICEKEVNSECGSYYCPDYCNFIAHVSCALEFEDKIRNEKALCQSQGLLTDRSV
ncbi:hypothetical protein Pint_36405 [Pistacia integerrima]|uniref:Uncharacterized protein n=1 Tax=Pistacia integerrima TaxID=434235 RepID=A0ACC0Y227_9ROSI|nr:hypothetical protein Pint_36405 [Pistacia integerrima]